MMTKTNDGEQELVIGNKQLLGIFFVVVVLLSVFFTMGYIIGRNTANAGAAQTTAASGTASGRAEVPAERTAPPDETRPQENAAPAATQPAPAARPAETPRTQPAAPYTAPASAAPAEAESHAPATLHAIPEGDLYLQVAAIPRADAETTRNVLRERGFPTLIGESSKPGLFRVLVGPFKDMTSLHISKDELKKAGFESFVVK